MITHEEYIDRLNEISLEKYSLLKDMLYLTEEQANSISEEKIDSLEKLVVEKQAKIEKINKLDEEFEVYFLRLKSVLNVKKLDELKGLKISGARELREAVGQILCVIEEISRLEKQNNEKAKGILKKLGRNIKNINQSKKMNSAYMPEPIKPPSYFIDKKK
jgi:flagellar biosynthesis chaperone FliJ